MTHPASDKPISTPDHPDFLAHHFDTPAQQFDAGKMGMWVFLVTEILFFGGLFCAYAVYRHTHPVMFSIGSTFLDRTMGAINTVVLILSSFTMALGVYFAQTSNRKALITCLSLTLLGGCVFMGIKGIEYADKIRHGKVWGEGYSYNPTDHHDPSAEHDQASDSGDSRGSKDAAEPHAQIATTAPTSTAALHRSQVELPATGPAGLAATVDGPRTNTPEPPLDYNRKDLQIFMGIYFCLTGLHGIHVLAGMIVITWLLIGAIKGRFSSRYYTPVDLGGLYWHLVDLIWIFLFPLLYLID